MNSATTPEDGFTHPLFISPLPYLYQITYQATKISSQVITYSSPHEIILNLHCFQNTDKITYTNKSTLEELFTITVDRFKYMMAESLYRVDQGQLELLYMRLLLTNRYSKSISDRGQFRQLDYTLRQFIIKGKGGYDIYLSMEQLHTILYSKIRRLSTIHLLSVIGDWNHQNDIHLNHINLPTTMQNRGLLYECLRVELTEKRFRLYTYTPVDGEDNILSTDISAELIQVINQLIK